MKSLRKAREVAIQILFQQEFAEDKSAHNLFHSFIENFEFDDQTIDYAQTLTEGTLDNLEKINEIINSYSENWRLDRMAMIDRIILQVATFELCLLAEPPTSPRLTLNDYIDLAKKYSSEDAKKFINGILDRVFNQYVAGSEQD